MLNVRAIKELIQRYNLGISPRRRGQHFLVDPRILERIAGTLEAQPGDKILEVGSGLGALTEVLLRNDAPLYAIEKDSRLIQVLTDRFRDAANLQLIQADILRLNLESYALGQPKSLLVAGNIPYSMTSPILEFLLQNRRWVKRAILTIQKEVALRIVAKPGTKEYSSLTLFVQVAFQPSIAFHIPPHAFYPQPKVTSSVLCLDPLSDAAVPSGEEEAVLKLIRILFTHRRKTMLNALVHPHIGVGKEQLSLLLDEAQFDPLRRPETLQLGEVVRLNRAIAAALR